jgi:hypothetical protein
MPKVIISTPDFNPNGTVELFAVTGSKCGNLRRRVTRTPTLDGKALLSDMGFAAADVEIEIRVDVISPLDLQKLKDGIRFFPLLHLSCQDGVYLGVINEFVFEELPFFFTFLVKEQLTQHDKESRVI